MKKTYVKPTLDMMSVEQETMMAASSLNIIENEELGAGNALGNEESDFNIWEQ